MTEHVYKLKNGKVISAYADERGNISITKEAFEIMANSWNDGYQKGFQNGVDTTTEKAKKSRWFEEEHIEDFLDWLLKNYYIKDNHMWDMEKEEILFEYKNEC